LDKPTLQKMARDLGCEFKANTVKSELVALIGAARDAQAQQAAAQTTAAAESESGSDSAPEAAPIEATLDTPADVTTTHVEGASTEVVPEGVVDTVTGELQDALDTAAAGLGTAASRA
jgi:hypothetical protein